MVRGSTVVDIKSTKPGGADPREFAKTARNLKYHWQQANYTNIAAKAGLTIDRWIWAVVENAPREPGAPIVAACYEFSPGDMKQANSELEEAYRKLQACLELKDWPAYTPTSPMTLNLFGHL